MLIIGQSMAYPMKFSEKFVENEREESKNFKF